jgi:hypothetical protein
VKLPFLDNQSRFPTSKEPDERVVNPSYDAQLQDSLVNELLEALEHRKSSQIKESLMALIHSIEDEERSKGE